MIQDLATLFLRDLDVLAREIALYPDDSSPWGLPAGLPNSGGTLALHLAGNLRHFVGAVLGGSGYVRDRDAEFALRDLPRTEILALVAAARNEVAATFERLDPALLDATYPLELAGRRLSTRLFLLQLLAHLDFHIGQVDYHRRVSTGSTGSAGAVSLRALGSPAAPAEG